MPTEPEAPLATGARPGSALRDVLLGLAIGSACIAIGCGLELLGCAHNGLGLLTFVACVAMLPAALVDLLVSGLGGLRRRPRVFLVVASLFVVLYFGQLPLYAARDVALTRTLCSANKIATAIQSFEREHHRLPKTLAELVPHTLPALPPTGLRGAPKFDYAASEFAPDDLGYWELSVDYPVGPFRFNKYKYVPARDGLPASLVPGS